MNRLRSIDAGKSYPELVAVLVIADDRIAVDDPAEFAFVKKGSVRLYLEVEIVRIITGIICGSICLAAKIVLLQLIAGIQITPGEGCGH